MITEHGSTLGKHTAGRDVESLRMHTGDATGEHVDEEKGTGSGDEFFADEAHHADKECSIKSISKASKTSRRSHSTSQRLSGEVMVDWLLSLSARRFSQYLRAAMLERSERTLASEQKRGEHPTECTIKSHHPSLFAGYEPKISAGGHYLQPLPTVILESTGMETYLSQMISDFREHPPPIHSPK